jgi:hypothetical protein
MKDELLLIPEKVDAERNSLAQSWVKNGGQVLYVGKFWIKPETHNKRITIYGNDTFVLVLAQVLNLNLLSTKDEEIASIDFRFVKRNLDIVSVNQVNQIQFPKFLKPVKPKLFKAQVFPSIKDLNEVIESFEKEELLICSEIIEIEKEIRAFILNQKIMDLAYYEGNGELALPKDFISSFLENSKISLPSSFVLDIGWNQKQGWFIIEVNSSWGAGLNSCHPDKVLKCIREATLNE